MIGSFRALERFLRTEVVGAGVAVTRALLLGEHHCLRADVILARGGGPLSFDQRQELIRLCLEHRASAAILARSAHGADPSIPDPAREANIVACSLEMLGMRLLDWVLVGASEVFARPMVPAVCCHRVDVLNPRGLDWHHGGVNSTRSLDSTLHGPEQTKRLDDSLHLLDCAIVADGIPSAAQW